MEDLDKFLEFLYGQAAGYVYSPVKSKTGNSWEQVFFQLPGEVEALKLHILANAIVGDVYLSPALFSDKKVSKANVSFCQVVWIEFDGKKDLNYRDVPKPCVVVQSSTSNHLHAYWQIPPVGSFQALENINRRLTYYLEADSSGWDATQVLRPPGTINHKYGQPIPVSLPTFKPKLFDFSAFDVAPEIDVIRAEYTYDELLDPDTIYKEHAVPQELVNRNRKALVLPGNRSSFLMATGHLLAEEGLDFKEILSLLYEVDSRVKKFPGRSDQLLRLSEIASIALAKFEVENTISFYTPNQIINHKSTLKWIIEGWLHTQGIMLLSGEPGVGKTQFSLDLAYRLAVGSNILTRPLSQSFSSVFISLEMTIEELQYILTLQGREFNENKELWDQNVKIFGMDETNLILLEKVFKEHQPQVIIVDSLSELCIDEMKEIEARRVMTWLKRVRRTFNCAQIVIHHNRKAQDGNRKPRKLSDLYGSFVFGKLSETVITLWQEEGKSYLELHSLKTRFGRKDIIQIERNENLTFKRKADVKLDVSGTTRSDGTRNPILGFE